jgi:2-polyprenyl-3-methyl-5-hydroxy-6-metoxy-1,4-benzoquinol methylase
LSARELKAQWDRLGETDPLWAVLSDAGREGGRWDVEAFMDTGRCTVQDALDIFRPHGVGLGERVLDFGCGVGRLSNAFGRTNGASNG